MAKTSLRAVPDTNILLASELSASETSPNKEFFTRWRADEFDLLYSRDTLDEYVKKMREKGLSRESLVRFLTGLLTFGIEISIGHYHLPAYPVDADDIAFLLCADNGSATHLVTHDRHLLDVDPYFDFRICRTTDFLDDLRQDVG